MKTKPSVPIVRLFTDMIRHWLQPARDPPAPSFQKTPADCPRSRTNLFKSFLVRCRPLASRTGIIVGQGNKPSGKNRLGAALPIDGANAMSITLAATFTFKHFYAELLQN